MQTKEKAMNDLQKENEQIIERLIEMVKSNRKSKNKAYNLKNIITFANHAKKKLRPSYESRVDEIVNQAKKDCRSLKVN